MKKLFTLVAAALCAAVNVNAQTTTSPVKVAIEKSVLNTEQQEVKDDNDQVIGQKEVAVSCDAEKLLSDNECFTATTVFAALAGTNDYTYKDGLGFTDWVQLRVKDEPTSENPSGTENKESTPIVIVAKKNATFNAYVRTGNNKACKLFDQSTVTEVEGTNDYVVDENSSSNNFWTFTWAIEAGKTYVLTEKGGTGRLSGFSYVLSDGGGTGISSVTAGKTVPDAPSYTIDGRRAGSAAKGIIVKDGKKFFKK